MVTVTKRFRAVDASRPYPGNCHPRWVEPGEQVNGRLAEIAVEMGCAGDAPSPPAPAGTTTEQDIAAAEAAALAAALANQTGETDDETGSGEQPPAVHRARMLKKAPGRAANGDQVNYAKGTIVEGQLALDMIAAGVAEPVVAEPA